MWRLSTPGDDKTLITLWSALNAEDPAEDPPPRAFMERSLKALRADPQRGRFVLLDLDGQACGYALLAAFWSSEQGGEMCVIDELYVTPAARGRGHGQALIREIMTASALWPVVPVGVDLEVSPNNTRACALYERLGFQRRRNLPMRWMRASQPET